ncbi:uncharacterized protein [Dermacentor andersoni]|uniref:uncharacterized protein n=1 Tax=Dermacentor andersoni TaxID=34620 RepID=UPI002417E333|nr:uncharacterized protein LOC129384833 [Dermacentor andersoni]
MMLASNSSKVETDIMNLWNQNISHFGYVDIGRLYVYGPSIERVLHVLKRVFEMLKGRQSVERPCYTLIVLPMNQHDTWLESITNIFRTSGHTPDALIGLAHLAEADFYSGYACRILPPLFLQLPSIPAKFQKDNYYRYNMNTTHTNLKIFATRERPSSALFVTVPMFAKWYTYFYDEYTFGTECGDTDLPSIYGTVAQACRSQDCNTTFVTTPEMGVLTACIQNYTVLTYENDESYRYKLCIMKKNMTRVRYGFLAMDIDTDDPSNHCGLGGYARLQNLRRLLEFFKNNFTSPDDYEDCVKGL